ncbi:hypothetical protein FVE85_5263 [Porphyridium purpureum]|uniref:Uncharacterized protein n=1 Tax=Porphyridium purpureum TaxID=35688 RepID=A0A5J4Z359_PORPP|nr:hypothetical protein FVE85_5263 [Porphyridium purpureum]|eukprot:POR6696..scf295_1
MEGTIGFVASLGSLGLANGERVGWNARCSQRKAWNGNALRVRSLGARSRRVSAPSARSTRSVALPSSWMTAFGDMVDRGFALNEELFMVASNALGGLEERSAHTERLLGSGGTFAFDALNMKGSVQGFVDPKSKLAWVTRATHLCDLEFKVQMLFLVAPITSVPHCSLIFGCNETGYFLELDYIPREDLVSNPPNYIDKYYGPERQAFVKAATENMNVEGVIMGSLCVEETIIRSPLHLNLQYGSDDASYRELETQCKVHLLQWLDFVASTEELNRSRRGLMFARDAAMHKMMFRTERMRAGFMFNGDEALAQKYAASLIGPGDEAYTGQAS